MKIEVITRNPESDVSHKIPILCVPGGYQGAWSWDEYFLPYFANAGFEAHAISLRGHGKSDGHDNIKHWRLADYVDDLATVIAKMPVPPVLIGHSVGGAVVQKYLEEHSVPAGILLAPSPITGVMSASFKMMMKYPVPYFKMAFTRDLLHALPMFETSFFSNEMPCERVRDYFKRMGNESYRAFMDIILLDKPEPSKVNTQMLIIGGEKDSSIPIKINNALAKAYGTELEMFPVAHEMMLDLNWELVAQRIVSWVTSREFDMGMIESDALLQSGL